jgi:hypothetical protein
MPVAKLSDFLTVRFFGGLKYPRQMQTLKLP